MTNITQKNTHILNLTTNKTSNNIQIWQTLTKQNNENFQQESSPAYNSSLYGTFNLGLHVQDDPKNVHRNRLQLLSQIQTEFPHIEQIHWLNQVHGNRVCDVDTTKIGNQAILADAHITTDNKIALAIMTADCVPIMVASERGEIIAGIHAGWQGLAKGIIFNTIDEMQKKLSLPNSENWQAWVGACIAHEHYEVDERVKNQVLDQLEQQLAQRTLQLKDEDKIRFFTPQVKKPGHYLADLPAITQFQLELYGLKTENIHLSGLDSYGDKQFYSYRQQSENNLPFTGRMAMVIFKA